MSTFFEILACASVLVAAGIAALYLFTWVISPPMICSNTSKQHAFGQWEEGNEHRDYYHPHQRVQRRKCEVCGWTQARDV